MRVLLSVLTVAIALAVPAVAHADAHDDDFVSSLAEQGITGDPAKLVSTAHTVCTSMNQTTAGLPAGLGRMLPMGYVLSSLRLSAGQADKFAGAAQGAYCPGPGDTAPSPALAAMPGIPGLGRLSSVLGGG